jgi:hypothetical protein
MMLYIICLLGLLGVVRGEVTARQLPLAVIGGVPPATSPSESNRAKYEKNVQEGRCKLFEACGSCHTTLADALAATPCDNQGILTASF